MEARKKKKKVKLEWPQFSGNCMPECVFDVVMPNATRARKFVIWFSSLTREEVRLMMGMSDREAAARKFNGLSEKSKLLMFNKYEKRFASIRARRMEVMLERKEKSLINKN